MWNRFPGLCPYCLSVPCACKEKRRKNRQRLKGKSNGQQPESLSDWQEMFARIYPNVVYVSAMHLAEEAGEVDEAIRNYQSTHKDEWFKKMVEELVDLITNIFGVANCLDISISAGMVGYFAKGCPGCKKSPCECGYVEVDQPLLIE
jgi:NTP pyrophosphatase (non-canonical NTP hydrolase)